MAEAEDAFAAGDLLEADLSAVVADADIIVNCAAFVHRTTNTDDDIADRVNRGLAISMAQAAKNAKASRFVQLSSVAAITSQTRPGEIADDATLPRPESPYGRSKRDADASLAAMSGPSFSVVSLRPPVIIGPGAAAWFGLLSRAASLGMPLPVGRVENRRSFVFVENVADAVAIAAQGMLTGSYVITDSDPLSTADLYRNLLELHGMPDRVWAWPAPAMRLIAKLALRSRASSLVGDAAFDGHRFRACFNWTPPVSFEDGLRLAVAEPARQ